ncbi:MAG: hypothetical protein ACUVX9_00520 [Anaerolineae bacterium]
MSHAVLVLTILLVVVCEGALFRLAMCEGTGGRWILPLDDAYIHQQYAVQAANGHLFRYDDAAPPTSGATSLLYPLILATAWGAGLRGDTLSTFAFALGGTCLFLAVVVAARVGQQLYSRLKIPDQRLGRHWVGLLVAALFLTNGALLWGSFSGMEGSLLIIFMLLTLHSFLARSSLRTALFGALLALTRPEGLLLVGMLLLVAVARAIRNRDGKRGWSWLYSLPPVAGMLHPLLNLVLTGSFTANGMRAKSWLYNVPFYPLPILRSIAETSARVWSHFLIGLENPLVLIKQPPGAAGWRFLSMPPLLAIIGLITLVVYARREWRCRRIDWATLLSLWVVSGLVSSATMGTALWHFYRYLLPFFALGLLAGGVGLLYLSCRVAGRKRGGMLAAGVGLLMVISSAQSLPGWLWRYREAVKTTLNQQVRMGEWIQQHLPEQARVGVHDVGAVRYYGGRATYDLVGLAEPPEASLAWRNGSGSIFEEMERSSPKPSHFAIYDDIYALPFFKRTDLFAEELLRVQHEDLANVASASDHQVVYAADWRLAGSGDAVRQQDLADLVRQLQLSDSLDVADLRAEGEHNYRWWQDQLKPGFPSDVFQLAYHLPPHQEVLDGGRLLTGGESFVLRTVPGQDMLLIGRFLGQSSVALDVRVDGRPVGRWGYGAIVGEWQERALRIPASYVTKTRTSVDITVEPGQADLEFHRPFYYWCYQGDLSAGAPQAAHPLNAAVGDSILLLGYSLAISQTESSLDLSLDLLWQATGPVTGDYKVFVHWSDGQEVILAQQDCRPGFDLQPTWLWRPGETVVDRHHLQLPLTSAPPLATVLYVGMYDPMTGERLPVAGGDDSRRLMLARFDQAHRLVE